MQDGALVPHVFALIFQLRQVSFFSVFVGKHIDLPEMLALYQIFQGVVCADVSSIRAKMDGITIFPPVYQRRGGRRR